LISFYIFFLSFVLQSLVTGIPHSQAASFRTTFLSACLANDNQGSIFWNFLQPYYKANHNQCFRHILSGDSEPKITEEYGFSGKKGKKHWIVPLTSSTFAALIRIRKQRFEQ
jgi:hypothetical protein